MSYVREECSTVLVKLLCIISHVGVFKLILCGNSRMDQYIVSRTSNRRGIVRWTTETDLRILFENLEKDFNGLTLKYLLVQYHTTTYSY